LLFICPLRIDLNENLFLNLFTNLLFCTFRRNENSSVSEIPRVKITDKKIVPACMRYVFIEGREVNNVFLNVSSVHKRRRRDLYPAAEPSLTAIKPTCNQSTGLPTVMCMKKEEHCVPSENHYAK